MDILSTHFNHQILWLSSFSLTRQKTPAVKRAEIHNKSSKTYKYRAFTSLLTATQIANDQPEAEAPKFKYRGLFS
ncbi:hypothetical protein [Psychromonas sp. MB-3u-54]|uniref:hypothetical protein n=1 Tax=Psychromonas sp. MB-3u-54 TaxID=2058319 RepID=UPI0018E3781B|nr:hypothetical protein [Psychromonas sp. MB-3u-54]